MVRIPGTRMKKMKNYHPMEYMRVIRYLKQPQRRISISGLLDTSLKTRNGDLQILAKTLRKVISLMNIHPYQNIAGGSFIFKEFATIARIQVVWLPVPGRLFIKGKRMELSS